MIKQNVWNSGDGNMYVVFADNERTNLVLISKHVQLPCICHIICSVETRVLQHLTTLLLLGINCIVSIRQS